MKIGILGYGKMGKDIFTLLNDKLTDTEFAVVDTVNAEAGQQSFLKTLSKSLKRGKITKQQFEKKQATVFSDDIAVLRDCDMIIEAVFENLELKQQIFRNLDKLVSERCLLLTNTSSLDISGIFEGISRRERCSGMHFFYPVKLSGFVELNILPETSAETIQTIRKVITASGKQAVIFRGEYHIYLNQILACMVSHGIYLCEYFDVSVPELGNALAELFPMAGVFEILDSIGLGLMASSPEHFRIARNRQLLDYGCQKMNQWLADGCPKETRTFLNFIGETSAPTGKPCTDAPLYMTALLLNEISASLAEYDDDKNILLEAVKDILGLAKTPSAYFEQYGREKLCSVLDDLYTKTGFLSYQSNLQKGSIFAS